MEDLVTSTSKIVRSSGSAEGVVSGTTASPIVQQDIAGIISGLGSVLNGLADRSLLITGATGFVGGYLLETIAALNDRIPGSPCRVYALTRDRRRAASRFPHLAGRSDVTFVEGDVRRLRLPEPGCDLIIHGAAPSDARVFRETPLDAFETIVDGTKAVLSAAASAKARVLFLSSGAVYGEQPATLERIPEDWMGGPNVQTSRSVYAEAKRCAELLCRIFHERHGVPVAVARLFALVGPCQDRNSTSAVIDFIKQALAGDTITIRDDPETSRSYCYVGDAVQALWTVLLRAEPGEVVNVGSDLEPITFRELAARISRCLGKRLRIVTEGLPATGILGHRYVPDVTHLRRTFGRAPAVGLDQALERTIAWMKEGRNPESGGR
jgi:UDP-glucuronate decarboxylase